MKLTLRELRSVLQEAINPDNLVKRGIDNVFPLLISNENHIVNLTVLRMENGIIEASAFARLRKLGKLEREDTLAHYELDTLWARDPSSAAFVLGASLATGKYVQPDLAVSPAAQGILKSYWAAYGNDESRIIKKTNPMYSEEPWLDAVYLQIPGLDFSKNVEAAQDMLTKQSGDHPGDLENKWTRLGLNAFDLAYSNPIKTGHLKKFDDILKGNEEDALQSVRTVLRSHDVKLKSDFGKWLGTKTNWQDLQTKISSTQVSTLTWKDTLQKLRTAYPSVVT